MDPVDPDPDLDPDPQNCWRPQNIWILLGSESATLVVANTFTHLDSAGKGGGRVGRGGEGIGISKFSMHPLKTCFVQPGWERFNHGGCQYLQLRWRQVRAIV